MALEPITVAVEEPPNVELADMTRRFWIAWALTMPVFVMGMTAMFGGRQGRWASWVELVLATPVVLWCGWPFFERAWTSLVNRRLNMFTLIGLGTGIAYVYSLIATLAPGAFPASFREHDGSVPVYFEAAAVITTLVLLGQVLELRACAGPAARSGHSWAWRRRPPAASRPTARNATCRSIASTSATVCASGPARKFLSMASCSKVRARWTNRC